MEAPSAELMARWRDGDHEAAEELFRRYAGRLLALARRRLSTKLAPVVDPEDVVQSAFRSFFSGVRGDRYALRRSGDLWRLLVAITLHKLQHQVERQTAGKRDIGRQRRLVREGSTDGALGQVPAREPTPAEAAALTDTLEQVFRGLEPLQRRMVEMRLQGSSLDEIAANVHRSERTVRRLLERIKERLEEQFRQYFNS
jgi:RNA polymerase sigma-70 factor (ECF subfamily)